MDIECKKLWIAVLKQAIKDSQRDAKSSIVRSQLWFYHDSKEVGSYLWICDILNLDPESIRSSIKLEIQEPFPKLINDYPVEYRAF